MRECAYVTYKPGPLLLLLVFLCMSILGEFFASKGLLNFPFTWTYKALLSSKVAVWCLLRMIKQSVCILFRNSVETPAFGRASSCDITCCPLLVTYYTTIALHRNDIGKSFEPFPSLLLVTVLITWNSSAWSVTCIEVCNKKCYASIILHWLIVFFVQGTVGAQILSLNVSAEHLHWRNLILQCLQPVSYKTSLIQGAVIKIDCGITFLTGINKA